MRSPELLDSAVHQAYQTYGGHDLYPTPFDKAAALIRSLTSNHPFLDGNKRTAWLAAWVLLRANNIRIVATTEEIVDLMVAVATRKLEVEDISNFLLDHAADTRPE